MDSASDSSHQSLNVFVGTYEYPEWFSRKKYIFYKKLLKRLEKLRYIHNSSSEYYVKLNYRIIGPSIVITSLSGIASFLSTSELIDDTSKSAFGISVGVLAAISTLLQSISGSCGFGNKSEAHRTAAEEYNKLMVRLKFEMEMPNEEDFTDKIESDILNIQNKCNYFPPQFIVDEWAKKRKESSKSSKSTSNISTLTKNNVENNNKLDLLTDISNIPKNGDVLIDIGLDDADAMV